MVGKWHLCPEDEMNLASTRRNWPTGPGFERFYGFLGAETNQWYPDLVHDNHPVDAAGDAGGGLPPHRRPHRQGDRVHRGRQGDRARTSRSSCYYAPGAAHAPHHAPKEWTDQYRGRFDMGYEAMREQTLARQKELGIVPATPSCRRSTRSAHRETRTGPDGKPFPPLDFTRPWDSLSADEQRLFARMAEVYAGFLAHADHQIGRLLDYLEEIGQRENTMVVVVSDNGASGEGGPNGSVNEMKFVNGLPDDLADEPAHARRARRPEDLQPLPQRLGDGVQHAVQDVEALRVQRRDRATRASSPGRRAWRPGARSATSTTTPSTSCRRSSTAWASSRPARSRATPRAPFDGRQHARTASTHPTRRRPRTTQFYSMLGSRGIWHDGWKAVTTHPALSGWSHFNEDVWELYHTDVDRSELHDLAAEHPDKLRELVEPLVRRGRRQRRLPARRPVGAGDHPDAPAAAVAAARTATSTARAAPRCPERSRGQRPQPVVRDRRLRRPARPRAPQGVLFAHGQPVRRPRAVRQGQPAALRQQLRRHASSRRSTPPRTCRPART